MIIPYVRDSKTVYKGKLITVRVDKLSRDGETPFFREIAETTDSVAIAAIDQQQRILLIQQYRHAMRKPVWEVPAGRMDVSGESPEQTALRELREEADIKAKSIRLLTTFGNSVGWTTERTHVFLAYDLENVPEFDRKEEESDIKKNWVPLMQAQKMVAEGTIDDAKTIVGIMLANPTGDSNYFSGLLAAGFLS